MSAVALFDQLAEQLAALGYRIRFENLGGCGGGLCEFAGKRACFVDLSLSLLDQVDQLQRALATLDSGLPLRRTA